MGILPFAEIIQRKGGDERITKAAEQIANSVRRGRRITEEILRFTRPAEPVLKTIDLGAWLGKLEPELHAVVGSAAEMVLVYPSEAVFARCDSAQMQQVVTNLVVNARDAMSEGGTITLSLTSCIGCPEMSSAPLSQGERFVRLTVHDEGTGIAPELLEQIFEPLFTTKRAGTGLGLAVARQVLTQHGGFIVAENAPGGGASFHVFLPQADRLD